MRLILRTTTLAALLLAAAVPASSQTYMPPVRPGTQAVPEGFITLQSNVTLGLAYAEGQTADAQVEEAQRTLYNLASKQCGIVLSTIASECRISNLSSTVNTQRMQRDFPQITVTAQISMVVKLK